MVVGADLVSALSGEEAQGRHKVCPYDTGKYKIANKEA